MNVTMCMTANHGNPIADGCGPLPFLNLPHGAAPRGRGEGTFPNIESERVFEYIVYQLGLWDFQVAAPLQKGADQNTLIDEASGHEFAKVLGVITPLVHEMPDRVKYQRQIAFAGDAQGSIVVWNWLRGRAPCWQEATPGGARQADQNPSAVKSRESFLKTLSGMRMMRSSRHKSAHWGQTRRGQMTIPGRRSREC
jgi:hypothetical protein